MGEQGIGWAIARLQEGFKVRRKGWNGKGMWLAIQRPSDSSEMTKSYIYMSTAQGDFIPWLCSQADILAVDWALAD